MNGFAGMADGICEAAWRFPELVNVFRRVPSSSVLPAVPSDPALKGSPADSSSELSGEVTPARCGDVGERD